MSLELALQRITELQTMLTPAPPASAAPQTQTAFSTALQSATSPASATWSATGATPATGGTNAGRAALAFAQAEVGQAEQPPGSNDSPRIAQYRQATAGSGVGPWCAYFVSWAARQAGTPLGDQGQGFGRVDDVWAWAERTGRATPAAGARPQPGDLIVWDEHIGIVESVGADGSINTVEGNSSDRVSKRTYGPDGGGAVGYVRLG
jgi:CHAP domain-containing protein